MGLSCSLSQSCRIEMEYRGFGRSIFTKAETLLEETDYQKAIRRLLPKGEDRPLKFRAVMDALFVGLFPWHEAPCRAFYQERGPNLESLLNKKQVEQYDAMLVVAIEAAHAIWKQNLMTEWATYRETVIQIFQQAA